MSGGGIFSPRTGTEETGLAGSRPILEAGIPRDRRRGFVIYCIAVALLILPSVWDNDADIDALANAMSYAALALGLNVVVGFAGLLDLGYAAFFAIGAYFYGILTSFQIMPLWSPFWQPFALVGLVEKMNQAGRTWCISRCRSGWRYRWPGWSRRCSGSCSGRRRCG